MAINPKQATFASAGKISQHTIPGGYSRIASSAIRLGFVSTGNLAILGVFEGLEPQKLQILGDFDDAQATIFTESFLEVLREGFDPGGELTPQEIGVIGINPSTQSAYTLLKSAAEKIVLTSTIWGLPANQISVKVETGTLAGSKKVTEKFKTETKTTRDIIKESISIQYTGAGSAAAITINGTSLATTVTSGPGGEDLSLTFASYPTIQEMIDAINAISTYTATLKSDGGDASSELDAVTAVDIKTAAVILKSDVQAMIDAINTELTFVTAALKAEAGLTSAMALANSQKATINVHYADQGGSGEEHIAADTVIASPDATDLATLITLLSEIQDSYVAHDDDAILASSWVYHQAQGTEYALASEVNPTTLQTCITVVNDIKAKLDLHMADSTSHTAGDSPAETVADAVYSAPATREVVDNVAFINLTGGTTGASTATEWSAGLTVAETEDIQLIGTGTDAAAITVLVDAHITKMNAVDGKNERQGIQGGETSLINAQDQAVSLNNSGMGVAWHEFKNFSRKGVLTQFGAVEYAAKLLGQASSLALNEPMTHKALKVSENVTKLTKQQKEQAILKGVIVAETASNGVTRTVRSITTYQGADIKFAEFSSVREMLFMVRDMRELLEATFVAKAGIASRLVSITTVVENRLKDYEDDLEIIVADPNNPSANPAFRDITWTIQGDVINVKHFANVVLPMNFIFSTHYFDILASTTASAA